MNEKKKETSTGYPKKATTTTVTNKTTTDINCNFSYDFRFSVVSLIPLYCEMFYPNGYILTFIYMWWFGTFLFDFYLNCFVFFVLFHCFFLYFVEILLSTAHCLRLFLFFFCCSCHFNIVVFFHSSQCRVITWFIFVIGRLIFHHFEYKLRATVSICNSVWPKLLLLDFFTLYNQMRCHVYA